MVLGHPFSRSPLREKVDLLRDSEAETDEGVAEAEVVTSISRANCNRLFAWWGGTKCVTRREYVRVGSGAASMRRTVTHFVPPHQAAGCRAVQGTGFKRL